MPRALGHGKEPWGAYSLIWAPLGGGPHSACFFGALGHSKFLGPFLGEEDGVRADSYPRGVACGPAPVPQSLT